MRVVRGGVTDVNSDANRLLEDDQVQQICVVYNLTFSAVVVINTGIEAAWQILGDHDLVSVTSQFSGESVVHLSHCTGTELCGYSDHSTTSEE